MCNKAVCCIRRSSIISRRETHHYTLLKILNEAKERSQLPFDVEEICSVDQTVKRGNSWVTDIIAIRNCIGHATTKIDDNLNIHFWNYKEGYNFSRIYKFEDFMFFIKIFTDYYLFRKYLLQW